MLGEGIEQLYVFVVFAVVGVAVAAVYIFGLGLFKSRLFGAIFDGVWGAVSLWLIWRVNLAVNNGQCRLFVFVAIAAGAAIAYFSCKRMLDKLSALLYNLFTTKLVDEPDGNDFSQKDNLDNVRSGDASVADAGVHATGVAYSAVVTKRPRRSVKRHDSARKQRRRNSKTRTGG